MPKQLWVSVKLMLVSERKARSTGTVVDLIDNRDHLFDGR